MVQNSSQIGDKHAMQGRNLAPTSHSPCGRRSCGLANDEVGREDEGRDLFGAVYEIDESLHGSLPYGFAVLAYGCELRVCILAQCDIIETNQGNVGWNA